MDASELLSISRQHKHYAAVIYLRVKDTNGIDCSLFMAKARVAQLKPMSIPRLELQAALLAVSSILNVTVDRRIFRSDSKTVLYWLR